MVILNSDTNGEIVHRNNIIFWFIAKWYVVPFHLVLDVGTDLVLHVGLSAEGRVEVRAPKGRTQMLDLGKLQGWSLHNH